MSTPVSRPDESEAAWQEANGAFVAGQLHRLRLGLARKIHWLRSRWRAEQEIRGPIEPLQAAVITDDAVNRMIATEDRSAEHAFYEQDPGARPLSRSIAEVERELDTWSASMAAQGAPRSTSCAACSASARSSATSCSCARRATWSPTSAGSMPTSRTTPGSGTRPLNSPSCFIAGRTPKPGRPGDPSCRRLPSAGSNSSSSSPSRPRARRSGRSAWMLGSAIISWASTGSTSGSRTSCDRSRRCPSRAPWRRLRPDCSTASARQGRAVAGGCSAQPVRRGGLRAARPGPIVVREARPPALPARRRSAAGRRPRASRAAPGPGEGGDPRAPDVLPGRPRAGRQGPGRDEPDGRPDRAAPRLLHRREPRPAPRRPGTPGRGRARSRAGGSAAALGGRAGRVRIVEQGRSTPSWSSSNSAPSRSPGPSTRPASAPDSRAPDRPMSRRPTTSGKRAGSRPPGN